MAEVTVTEADVARRADGVQVTVGTAGEAITQGQFVYLKASDGKYYKAGAASTAEVAAAVGMALTPAAAIDDPIDIATSGDVDPGGTLTATEVYAIETTLGSFGPHSGLASGEYGTVVGVATAADTLRLGFIVSGVTKP